MRLRSLRTRSKRHYGYTCYRQLRFSPTASDNDPDLHYFIASNNGRDMYCRSHKMIKIRLLAIASFLFPGTGAALGDDATQVFYDALLIDYAYVMTLAEACDLSTRHGLIGDLLIEFSPWIDTNVLEKHLNEAYQAERIFLPSACPTEAFKSAVRMYKSSIENLKYTLENDGRYPGQRDEPKSAPQVAPADSNTEPPQPTTQPSNNLGKIAFGSRAGSEATIVSKSGINTEEAKIEVVITREDAVAACTEYNQDTSEECVISVMTRPLERFITANCKTGVFMNFNGDWHQFIGRHNLLYGDTTGEYDIFNLDTKAIADGSSASGYYVNLGIFEAMCAQRLLMR